MCVLYCVRINSFRLQSYLSGDTKVLHSFKDSDNLGFPIKFHTLVKAGKPLGSTPYLYIVTVFLYVRFFIHINKKQIFTFWARLLVRES